MKTNLLMTARALEGDIVFYKKYIEISKETLQKQEATAEEKEEAKEIIADFSKKADIFEKRVKKYRKMAEEESEKETPFDVAGLEFLPTWKGYYCGKFGESFYVYTKQCEMVYCLLEKEMEPEDGKFYGCISNSENSRYLCKDKNGKYVLKTDDKDLAEFDNPEEVGWLLYNLEFPNEDCV